MKCLFLRQSKSVEYQLCQAAQSSFMLNNCMAINCVPEYLNTNSDRWPVVSSQARLLLSADSTVPG